MAQSRRRVTGPKHAKPSGAPEVHTRNPIDITALRDLLAGNETCRRFEEVEVSSQSPTGEGQEAINHPQHYGGEENVYEAIKVIEAWNLGFCLGNAVKYICRAGKKNALLEDLKKAQWYLSREISKLEAL